MGARTGLVALLAFATAACAGDDDDGPHEPDASASPDAGADGGAADSETDAGRDAGLDAAPDAGPDVADLLAAIEGLTATDRGNAGGDYRFFELVLEQPIDHAAPEGATFEQHLTLLHRSVEAPMVLVTTGYDNYIRDRLEDLALRLSANQLVVEKRYHGASRPEVVDWTTLNVDQISSDLHRIVQALGTVYDGVWVGTGRSMGGADSIYHRRFFPADVAGTVAYATAFMTGYPDARFPGFFAETLDASCQAALEAVQIAMLRERREAMIGLAEELAGVRGYAFDRLGGVEPGLETSVLSLPWVFWQYRGIAECGLVPEADAADDAALYDFFEAVQGIRSANDEWWDYFGPYYYQMQGQLGVPEIPAGHLEGLISPDVVDIEEGLIPEDADPPAFDPAIVPDVLTWLDEEAAGVVLVYGELDPWSASRPHLSGASDVEAFVAPGENHGAQIADLEPEDRDAVLDRLEEWTGAAVAR